MSFLLLDGGLGRLDIGDPDSWRALTEIDRLGVPTATTVLSALWPQRVVIVDRRDSQAAIALHKGASFKGNPDLDNADALNRDSSCEMYWKFNEWFQDVHVTVEAATGCTRLDIERALFVVNGLVVANLR